jgi:hypothetical protein
VRARYEHVELALPEAHLLLHVSKLEAPRLDESEVVVCPAADALPDRFCEPFREDGAHRRACHHRLVGLGHARRDLLDDGVGIRACLRGERQ